MFCTNCGKEAVEGALFCTNCGARLIQEPVAQQPSGQQSGSVVDETVKIKTKGASQADSGNTGAAAPNPDKRKLNPVLIIVAAAAVVIIALALILAGGGGGYKDHKKLAQAYYEAIYREDVDALIKLFDKEAQQDLREDKEDVQQAIERMKDYLNYEYGRKWFEGLEAGRRETVDKKKGIYRMEIEIDEVFHDYLYIKKDDRDRFYIDEGHFYY